jgi:hypothetical protein
VLATPQNQLMLGRLRRGYSPDPKLAGFTGWIVEKLAMSAGTPGFNQAEMFPSRTTTFWRYPDPSLPRARVDAGTAPTLPVEALQRDGVSRASPAPRLREKLHDK